MKNPTDPRVLAAREYLDAIRPYKVSERPPFVLARECAELRRMLGQMLDIIEHPKDRTPLELMAGRTQPGGGWISGSCRSGK